MKHIKYIFFVLIMINCSFFLKSQEKSIIIIIDTIKSYNLLNKFSIQYSYGHLYNFPLMSESMNNEIKITSKNTATFKGSIKTNSDTTIIQIPIDTKNGYLEIIYQSSFKHQDTLKIECLKIFKSDIIDTTITEIKFFRCSNGTISDEAYKIKKRIKIEQERNDNVHFKDLLLKINEKEYVVFLDKVNGISRDVMLFDGQKPINSQNPRIRFFGTKMKMNWYYFGRIKITQ